MHIPSVEEFLEKYDQYLLNGRTDGAAYIPLKVDYDTGINISLRPYAERIDANMVLFGGKFRVAYMLDDWGHVIEGQVVDLHDEDKAKRLHDACKGFNWTRASAKRFSTVVGVVMAATQYQPEVLTKVVDLGIATELLDHIHNMYKENNDGEFENLKKAAACLQDAWMLQGANHFKQASKLHPEVAGTHSEIINKGDDTYKSNVVSFREKVEQLQAAIDQADAE